MLVYSCECITFLYEAIKFAATFLDGVKLPNDAFMHFTIDLFHNGGQIKYSFVLMPVSLTSLATTSKFQKNFCFKMRPLGLINIKTKEFKSSRHL